MVEKKDCSMNDLSVQLRFFKKLNTRKIHQSLKPDNSVRGFAEDIKRREHRRTLVFQASDNASDLVKSRAFADSNVEHFLVEFVAPFWCTS